MVLGVTSFSVSYQKKIRWICSKNCLIETFYLNVTFLFFLQFLVCRYLIQREFQINVPKQRRSAKLECCQNMEVNLTSKKSVPIFLKARPAPFALRSKIKEEIDRLGIIEQEPYPEYTSLVVPVSKYNGSSRLYADYSTTLNKQLLIEKYPLPRIEDCFLSYNPAFYKIRFIWCL